jgi:hypothetical protein
LPLGPIASATASRELEDPLVPHQVANAVAGEDEDTAVLQRHRLLDGRRETQRPADHDLHLLDRTT